MKKIIIAIALTLLLGPGAGHVYLRRYKRAMLLIVTSLFFAFLLAWLVARTATAAQLPVSGTSQLFRNYSAQHAGIIFLFDSIFAALWAYALVDSFFRARAEIPAASCNSPE